MPTRILVLSLALLAVCCAGASAAPRKPLRVLVTNDDGVRAPGIDALVQQLATNPGLQLTVVAPATNQSGTGDAFTATPIDVTPSSTAGAFPATAVAGRPADSVLFGVLYALPERPDLVVSGINFGQNAGELVNLSGTVGAALTAARLGIPAIAASYGLSSSASDYAETATYVGELVERFRKSRGLRAKLTTRSGASALVLNVNFPRCTTGSTRGVLLVPTGRLGRVTGYALTGSVGSTQTFTPAIASLNPFVSDCLSAVAKPPTDVEALVNGFASVTPLNPDLTVSQRIRSFRFLGR